MKTEEPQIATIKGHSIKENPNDIKVIVHIEQKVQGPTIVTCVDDLDPEFVKKIVRYINKQLSTAKSENRAIVHNELATEIERVDIAPQLASYWVANYVERFDLRRYGAEWIETSANLSKSGTHQNVLRFGDTNHISLIRCSPRG
jgi:hypothetical protein